MADPRQALHGRLAGVITEVVELTNIQNDFAAQYDAASIYNTGDYVMKKDMLFKAKVDGITGTWDVSKWDSVAITNEMKAGTVGKYNTLAAAPAYNAASTYTTGDLITYNDGLYKANKDITVAKPFDIADWDSTDIAAELDNIEFIDDTTTTSTTKTWSANKLNGHLTNVLSDIAKSYSETSVYNIDNYAIKDDVLYICNADNVTGTWDPTKWTAAHLADRVEANTYNINLKFDAAGVADDWVKTRAYTAGAYVNHNNKLYQANKNIAAGTEFSTADWEKVLVIDAIKSSSKPYTFIIDSDSALAEFLSGDISKGQNYADVYVMDGDWSYTGNVSLASSAKHLCGNKGMLNINSTTFNKMFDALNIEDINFVLTNTAGTFSEEVHGIFYNCYVRNSNIAITGFENFNYSESEFSMFFMGRSENVLVLVGDTMECAKNMNTNFIVYNEVDTVIHGGVHDNLYNDNLMNNMHIIHYMNCYIVESMASLASVYTKQHNFQGRTIILNCSRVINNKIETAVNCSVTGIKNDGTVFEKDLIISGNYISNYASNDAVVACATSTETVGIDVSKVNVPITGNKIMLNGRNQKGISLFEATCTISGNDIIIGHWDDGATESIIYTGIDITTKPGCTQNMSGNTITIQYSTALNDIMAGLICSENTSGSLFNGNIIKLKNLHGSPVALTSPIKYIDTCTYAANNIFMKTDISGNLYGCINAFNNIEI